MDVFPARYYYAVVVTLSWKCCSHILWCLQCRQLTYRMSIAVAMTTSSDSAAINRLITSRHSLRSHYVIGELVTKWRHPTGECLQLDVNSRIK